MASIRENTLKTGETTWTVLYRHGGKQGSKTFPTLKGAEKFVGLIDATDVGRALDILAQGDRAPVGPTVAELARDWFEWKRPDVEPRTMKDYERDYDNWIDPFFGHRQAATVTEADVQTWVDRNLRPRLSPKTVADRHALLHGIYDWASAKKRGMVPRNPCDETDLPRRTKKPPKGLTLGEWATLRDAAYRVEGGEDAADLILFMASTGWRIGEATALMVRGVEDETPMYVSMTHVNRKGLGVVEGAKSDAGYRRIKVSADCAAMIRRRLVGKGSADYVFTNRHSPTGLWEPSTFRNRWWAKAVKEAGLEGRKPTPHWLRHTHVMLCHAAGMTLPEIQRRIGHEDIKTTINVYGRMIDDMTDEVSDRLDLLLTGRALPVKGHVAPADTATVYGELVE